MPAPIETGISSFTTNESLGISTAPMYLETRSEQVCMYVGRSAGRSVGRKHEVPRWGEARGGAVWIGFSPVRLGCCPFPLVLFCLSRVCVVCVCVLVCWFVCPFVWSVSIWFHLPWSPRTGFSLPAPGAFGDGSTSSPAPCALCPAACSMRHSTVLFVCPLITGVGGLR